MPRPPAPHRAAPSRRASSHRPPRARASSLPPRPPTRNYSADLLGPDHRHLGPAIPDHTDHHEPAHRAGSSAGLHGNRRAPHGDGTTSVTSNTPAVCSTNGLAVTYVGVGTCSLNAQVAARHQLSGGLWRRPDASRSGGPTRPRRPSPTSRRPPTSSSASRPSWARPATARRRSPPARRRCAASAPTGSRSPSWASAPAR